MIMMPMCPIQRKMTKISNQLECCFPFFKAEQYSILQLVLGICGCKPWNIEDPFI